MNIICVGGWACGNWLWERHSRRLRELMPGQTLKVTCVPACDDVAALESGNHFDLAIGHSLGLLWLLDSEQVSFDRLVSIGGFTRFTCAEDFPASPGEQTTAAADEEFHRHIAAADAKPVGWPDRVLARMQRGLAINPGQVLADFFKNAGAPDLVPQVEPDMEWLDRGLAALRNTDCREQWNVFAGPRRVIAAIDDQIVTAAHTRACFPACEIQWLKTDCHLLPLRFPEICAALIREMLEQA